MLTVLLVSQVAGPYEACVHTLCTHIHDTYRPIGFLESWVTRVVWLKEEWHAYERELQRLLMNM